MAVVYAEGGVNPYRAWSHKMSAATRRFVPFVVLEKSLFQNNATNKAAFVLYCNKAVAGVELHPWNLS